VVKAVLSLTEGDLPTSLRDNIENKGYQISTLKDNNTQSLEVTAIKNREIQKLKMVGEPKTAPVFNRKHLHVNPFGRQNNF